MEHKIYNTKLANTTLTVEIGKLAEQANGACTVQCGDTVVFVAVTASKKPRDGIDFLPLSVDFEEKMYSVGRIPGGFLKREGRSSEKGILTSRLIDRPIRPLFPKGFRNDVNVFVSALSIDPKYPPEIFGMLGSSIALSISDIPFLGPTGSVAVGMIDGEYIINPDSDQKSKSDLDLIVSGTKDAIMMVEAGANEVSETEMLEAIMFGHEYIKELVEFQEKIVDEVGKPKFSYISFIPNEDLAKEVREYAYDKLHQGLSTFDRQERQENTEKINEDVLDYFADKFPECEGEIKDVLDGITKEIVRGRILDEGIRPDGRRLTEIRPLSSEVGLLPRAHGSGLFKRGQTQVLDVCTLGQLRDEQVLDNIWEEESKRYLHHYNFPPFCVGEARSPRSPGRREIGHGHLAEMALYPVIPSEEEFPYTIRLVSEVMSSNGSSSQASVCASTLSLMDAGVPIKAPVSGVAMGLIKNADSDRIAILTDIQGLEDALGDMDFKVAGTEEGITAIQMDIKIKGISKSILSSALSQAKEARHTILESMLKAISKPRENISPFAPKIIQTNIDPDKIRDVIGTGGKVINKIIDETGVKIDIEDNGQVYIAGDDVKSAEKALEIIEGIVKDVKVGDVYNGKVVRIVNFGAFVEILPGKEGLVHISKLAHNRVNKVEDVVNVGDELSVKVMEIDSQNRINLSHKDTIPAPEKSDDSKRSNSYQKKRYSGGSNQRYNKDNK